MMVGSMLGVLFVSLVRRVLVEDPSLPFPESVAAAEIHKAGQRGADAARYLFWSIGLGTLVQALGEFKLYAVDKDFIVRIGQTRQEHRAPGTARQHEMSCKPARSRRSPRPPSAPRYMGVGYVIGPELAALQFLRQRAGVGRAGSADDVLPRARICKNSCPPGAGDGGWAGMAAAVWRYIVRPIAVGGMMVGAAYTLFRMGKNLTSSLGRALAEVRHGAPPHGIHGPHRTLHGIEDRALADRRRVPAMIALYFYISGQMVRGGGRRRGHADRRILLRHRFRQPGAA